MLKFAVLYGLPFTADIIVSLVLFVGRHGLASRGFDEATVGSIVLFYGIGYVLASLLMSRIVKPRYAKQQMLGALIGIVVLCILLANVQQVAVIQVLYTLFPLATSLYFNTFQIYMLGISNQEARPLAVTAGHFTLAWSLGYALGPLVSSQLRRTLPWSDIYYLASAIALAMAVVLYSFKPHPAQQRATAAQPSATLHDGGHNLVGAAWFGVLVGWTAWTAVVIWWAVQAVQLGASPTLKGSVEFVFALTQGLSALALTAWKGWHRKPLAMALLGASSVAALIMLSLGRNALFVVGASLFGVYTGGMFSYLVYHSMVDEEKAVQRVALNETFVGVCFLIASPVAALLHGNGATFGQAYLRLAVIQGAAIIVQTLAIVLLLRRRAGVVAEV